MKLVAKSLDELREQRLAIPSLFVEGIGVKRALGSDGEPRFGPTELELILWLPVGDEPSWNDVASLLGEPGELSSRRIPAAVLEALGVAGLVERDKDGAIAGRARGPSELFGNVFWRNTYMLAIRGGLLVALTKG